MFAVVKIEAPNDTNGNPRRGWIVSSMSDVAAGVPLRTTSRSTTIYRRESRTIAFVDEGYAGLGALYQWLASKGFTRAEFVDLGSIPVSASYYRICRKAEYGK